MKLSDLSPADLWAMYQYSKEMEVRWNNEPLRGSEKKRETNPYSINKFKAFAELHNKDKKINYNG